MCKWRSTAFPDVVCIVVRTASIKRSKLNAWNPIIFYKLGKKEPSPLHNAHMSNYIFPITMTDLNWMNSTWSSLFLHPTGYLWSQCQDILVHHIKHYFLRLTNPRNIILMWHIIKNKKVQVITFFSADKAWLHFVVVVWH